MISLAIASLSALAVWLTVRTFRPPEAVAAARLAALRPAVRERVMAPKSRGMTPVTRFLRLLGRIRTAEGAAEKRALAEAGMGAMDPAVFGGWQVCMGAIGFLFGLQAGAGAILAAPALAFAGFKAPELYLSIRARSRKDEAAAALPDAVDLLVVCTQAGLNLSLSLQRVAENTPGYLGKELRRVVEEIALGVPRAQALESLADRSGSEEISSLVGTLANADRFGTGVAAALEGFANEVRQVRKRRAEEQARKAPVKILFPMVFLILPAFLVLTVLPVVLGTLRSIGF